MLLVAAQRHRPSRHDLCPGSAPIIAEVSDAALQYFWLQATSYQVILTVSKANPVPCSYKSLLQSYIYKPLPSLCERNSNSVQTSPSLAFHVSLMCAQESKAKSSLSCLLLPSPGCESDPDFAVQQPDGLWVETVPESGPVKSVRLGGLGAERIIWACRGPG